MGRARSPARNIAALPISTKRCWLSWRPFKYRIVRVAIHLLVARRRDRMRGSELLTNVVRNGIRDLVLDGEDVREIPVKPGAP